MIQNVCELFDDINEWFFRRVALLLFVRDSGNAHASASDGTEREHSVCPAQKPSARQQFGTQDPCDHFR